MLGRVGERLVGDQRKLRDKADRESFLSGGEILKFSDFVSNIRPLSGGEIFKFSDFVSNI